MIAQNLESKTESKSDFNFTKAELLRKIEIKKDQLQIAHEGNMLYVIEALQTQLEELLQEVNPHSDSEFQALMSLAED
ncbi:MAG: hypothetical protein AAF378_02280 [Cyanobacteria bacterium P01_A01_bin.84]